MAEDFRPTEAMAEEAERALEWRREFGRGGTPVGVARARDISNRKNLSQRTVNRMHSYFSRHEVDKKGKGFSPGEEGYPSAGRIAWGLWGGDPGQSWARARASSSNSVESFATPGPDHSDGIMIHLTPDDPSRFAVKNGLPESELHITLLYCGDTSNTDVEWVKREFLPELESIAANWPHLEGDVTAVTEFGLSHPGDHPLVLLVDVPHLSRLRAEIMQAWYDCGGSHDNPNNHDFMPHMTLCYGSSDADIEFAETLIGQPLRFNQVHALIGEDPHPFDLAGKDIEDIYESNGDFAVPLEEMSRFVAGPIQHSDEPTGSFGMYEVVENSELCAEEGLSVAVVNENGELISCYETVEEANEAIANMIDTPDQESGEPEDVPPEFAEFSAVPPHETPTTDVEWDGPETETKVLSNQEAGYYDKIYAWRDPEGDVGAKSNWRFIHHEVSEEGTPGDANLRACITGIAVLNGARGGTTIPAEDREGVYRHLAAHLADAGQEAPELKTEEDMSEESSESTETEAAATEAATFRAVPSHSTPTTDDPEWSGDQAKARARVGETPAYYEKIYAWVDSQESPDHKTAYKFPHHVVSEDGTPGAAVDWICYTSIMVIDDSAIPEGDWAGVYNHLARHLRDAGYTAEEIPEVGDDNASIDQVRSAIATVRSNFINKSFSSEPVTATVEQPKGALGIDDDALVGEVVRRFIESALRDKEPKLVNSTDTEVFAETPEEVEPEVEAPEYDWQGILIVEGLPSGDGRMIAPGALTWRNLPVPLMLQTITAEGHDGAVIAGSIHEIERVGQDIIGRGFFDSGQAGQEARRLLSEGTMRGVSADIDSVIMELQDADGNAIPMEDLPERGNEAYEVLVEGRIMGATQVPFPAFQEAYLEVINREDASMDEAIVASGGSNGEVWRFTSPAKMVENGEELELTPVVASAGEIVDPPLHPPLDWFSLGNTDDDTPFTVYANGRIYGLIAEWGACHIGFRNRCVTVPKSASNYRYFRNKRTLTAEGELVATGPIYMDTVHPDLKMRASDAEAFYAHTGCAVADVAVYETDRGIVVAGAVRSSATPEQIRALRASDVSPDWRNIKGKLETVGLLAVNVSGFIVQGLAASAGTDNAVAPMTVRARYNASTDEIESLVAAGSIQKHTCQSCREKASDSDLWVKLAELEAKLNTLSAAVRPMRLERAAQQSSRWIDRNAAD